MQTSRFGNGTIVPISGTTDEVHMMEDVQVMKLVEKELENGEERRVREESELERLIWK